MQKKRFGDERLDTKGNVYFIRLNKSDDLIFLCDPGKIDVKKEEFEYSVFINKGGIVVDKETHIIIIELLNYNKDMVGYRVLPYSIIMYPEDNLELDWNISVVTADGNINIDA